MARKSATPPSYYGEPHKFDPTFRGPVPKRGCTDVLCCVLFIIVILGYIALGTVAWMHGDMRKVIYPTDSYGQFCGQQGTPNADKAILFYFNILHCANPAVLVNLQCPTVQLCVSKCPDRFATYLDVQHNYSRNRTSWDYYRHFCKPGFNSPEKVPSCLERKGEETDSLRLTESRTRTLKESQTHRLMESLIQRLSGSATDRLTDYWIPCSSVQ